MQARVICAKDVCKLHLAQAPAEKYMSLSAKNGPVDFSWLCRVRTGSGDQLVSLSFA